MWLVNRTRNLAVFFHQHLGHYIVGRVVFFGSRVRRLLDCHKFRFFVASSFGVDSQGLFSSLASGPVLSIEKLLVCATGCNGGSMAQ